MSADGGQARDLSAWNFLAAVVAIVVAIGIYALQSQHDSAEKSVKITTMLFVNPTSGYTEGSSWPVFMAMTNDGPAEAKNVSAFLQLVNPQRMRHAEPKVADKPAGATVEISPHGHGDEYDINIKNILPRTSAIISIEFRAENPDLKKELLDAFKADPFSGVFIAQFIKELSFTGENITSEINAGILPAVSS
jgi:hypothetical protein